MIHEVLAEGAENARTGRELATLFNCDIRQVTIQIEKERREGWPICANSSGDTAGYFLAADAEELKSYCNRIHRRASELYKTRRALLKVLQAIAEKGADNGKTENCIR